MCKEQLGFPGDSMVKNPPADAGDTGSILGLGWLPEILVVPREKTPTGAAARGNP